MPSFLSGVAFGSCFRCLPAMASSAAAHAVERIKRPVRRVLPFLDMVGIERDARPATWPALIMLRVFAAVAGPALHMLAPFPMRCRTEIGVGLFRRSRDKRRQRLRQWGQRAETWRHQLIACSQR